MEPILIEIATHELDAIKERVNNATAGPWEVEWSPHACEHERHDDWRHDHDPSKCSFKQVRYIIDADGDYLVETDSGCYRPHHHDAMFIAAARTDIPKLLHHVAAQKESIEELLEEHYKCKSILDAVVQGYLGLPLSDHIEQVIKELQK